MKHSIVRKTVTLAAIPAAMAVLLVACATGPSSADYDKQAADMVKAAFRDEGIVKVAVLEQDDALRECSAADVAGAPLDTKRAKEIEQERRRAEQGVRDQFKEWLRVAGKDRAMVTRIAHEQAAFSSRREELCRNYARESEHGYCALMFTEARSSAIAAHILPPEPPPEERPAARAKRR